MDVWIQGKAPGLHNGPSHLKDWEIIKVGWRNEGENETNTPQHHIMVHSLFQTAAAEILLLFLLAFSFLFPLSLHTDEMKHGKQGPLSASTLHWQFNPQGQPVWWASDYSHHKYNWTDKPLIYGRVMPTANCTTAKSFSDPPQQGLVLTWVHEQLELQ